MESIKNTIRSNRLEAKRLKANSSNRANSIYKKQTKAENFSTEAKATMIIEALKGDIGWLRWYCKVINTLSESTVQNILEGSRKAKSPANYFARAASIEMKKHG